MTSRAPAKKTTRSLPAKKPSALLTEWLAPKYRDPHAFARAYQTAKPFPHIVLPRLFNPKKVDALRAAMVRLADAGGFTHKEGDLFSLAQSSDFASATDPTLVSLRAFFSSPEWTEYLRALTRVALTGKQLDMGGSLYLDKDYLLCHDDQVTGRKIAYILYLGPDFAVRDGGALALLATKNGKPAAVVHRHVPRYNTLAMFTVSDKSWHAVEEVIGDKPRLSINGWFH